MRSGEQGPNLKGVQKKQTWSPQAPLALTFMPRGEGLGVKPPAKIQTNQPKPHLWKHDAVQKHAAKTHHSATTSVSKLPQLLFQARQPLVKPMYMDFRICLVFLISRFVVYIVFSISVCVFQLPDPSLVDSGQIVIDSR